MLKSQLDSLIVQFNLPDLAIAVNRDNREIFSAGYGHTNADCTQLIDANTLFGVASITKLITTITILLMQDRGQLSVHDCVSRYYPTLKAASNPNLKVHHLLTHASGWPGMASRFQATNLSAPNDVSGGIASSRSNDHSKVKGLRNTDDLVAYMNQLKVTPLAEPGQLLSYSNEGFCLLGGIIEQVTGRSWQHTIELDVFRPLHMLHSTSGIPDSSRFKSIAQPITINDTQRSAAGIWDAPLFYPAGGAVVSVRDLLRLMTVLSPDGPLLEAHSRAQLLAPAMSVASRPVDNFGYSLGLEYRQFSSGPVMHWHTGQRAGVSALVAALPASGLSMALLSNSTDAPLSAIAHQLIAHLVSDCDPHWPPASNLPESPATEFDPTGHYGSNEGFSYQVTQRDGSFFLCHGTDTSGEVLHFRTAASGHAGQQTFAFLTDTDTTPNVDTNRPPNNKPWALALDLRVLPRIS